MAKKAKQERQPPRESQNALHTLTTKEAIEKAKVEDKLQELVIKRSEESAKIKLEQEKTEEIKVAKFIMLTLQQSMTRYRGASGQGYTIGKDQPFEVRDKEDIKFFSSSPIFKRVSIFAKSNVVRKDIDELLDDELKKIKGLTPKTRENIVDLYVSMDHLIELVEEGHNLDSSIPKKQGEKLIKYIQKQMEGEH